MVRVADATAPTITPAPVSGDNPDFMKPRDIFAAQALVGLLAVHPYGTLANAKQIAVNAYRLADAMVAVRNGAADGEDSDK